MKRISWIILLMIVFSLALTACGSSEPEEPVVPAAPTAQEEAAAPALEAVDVEPEEETAVSEEPEVVEPVAEMAEENEAALTNLKITSLEDLTSYRYTMLMEITATDNSGVETTQSIQMEMAVSTEPPATSMSMTADGSVEIEEMGIMEFVQIEDTSYINMGELGCMVLPVDDNNAMSTNELTDGFSPEAITEDLENLTLVGEEKIDGIDVLHYTYDETSMIAEAAAGIESVEGHIYVAKDGGYMVRSIIDIVGDSKFMEGFANENLQTETATTHIEMNLTDVNSAVAILPPAACEGQELPEAVNWPMLEDASEVTSFAGIVSYTTEVSGDDAIEFYKSEMPNLDYVLDEANSFVAAGNGLLIFVNMDDETITITIAEDTNSGLTTVTILSEAGI